jgi:RHS repeat-associated protein
VNTRNPRVAGNVRALRGGAVRRLLAWRRRRAHSAEGGCRVVCAAALCLLLPSVVSAQSEVIEYYATDAVGSIRVVFDASGNVPARSDYLPFGEAVNATGSLPAQRFTGQERDSEIGADYFKARNLLTRVGRFGSVDPVGGDIHRPQSWNRYAYVENSPILHNDPSGMCASDSYDDTSATCTENPSDPRGGGGAGGGNGNGNRQCNRDRCDGGGGGGGDGTGETPAPTDIPSDPPLVETIVKEIIKATSVEQPPPPDPNWVPATDPIYDRQCKGVVARGQESFRAITHTGGSVVSAASAVLEFVGPAVIVPGAYVAGKVWSTLNSALNTAAADIAGVRTTSKILYESGPSGLFSSEGAVAAGVEFLKDAAVFGAFAGGAALGVGMDAVYSEAQCQALRAAGF